MICHQTVDHTYANAGQMSPEGGGKCLKSLGKIENLYRERDPEEEILNPSSYLKHT